MWAGGLPVGFLLGLPGASVSPVPEGMGWGSPRSSRPWGSGGFTCWVLTDTWCLFGRPGVCARLPEDRGLRSSCCRFRLSWAFHRPLSPRFLLCLVTEHFRHCPDSWVSHTKGVIHLWVWDAGQSFRAGVPSELPASTSPRQLPQEPQPAPTDHPLAEMSPHLNPFYITTGPDPLRSLHALLPTQVRDPQPCNTHPHSRLRQMVGVSVVTPGHHRSGRVGTGSCKAEDAKLAPGLL